MASKSSDIRDIVLKELKDLGVEDVQYNITSGSHQSVLFHVNNRRVRFTFALTPRGQRFAKNIVTRIRRKVRQARGEI